MLSSQNNSPSSFGIQPPINWEVLYPDPVQRAGAKARYDTLLEEQQSLLATENEQINEINEEMQRLIGMQQQPTNFVPHTGPMSPMESNIPQPAAAAINNSGTLDERLEQAKKKEQALRSSPTATSGELAVIQQEIKNLQDQLAK